jgi:hypothetical protein
MRGILLSAAGLVGLLALSAATAGGQPQQVELRGKLRSGVVAVGGETTGTAIETDKGRFELDLGNDQRLRRHADKLDGEAVVVKGTLAVRKGVEVAERRIVTVRSLEAVGDRAQAKADMRGRVSRVSPAPHADRAAGLLGSVLIEGGTGYGLGYSKARVCVTGKTKVERLAGGRRRPARFEDLTKGCWVQVWFVGPVAESNPVQATAGALLILDGAP